MWWKTAILRSEWFLTNSWLEYSQTTDSVFCFACCHFSVLSTNVEKSFTSLFGQSGGFTKHCHADYHRDAMVAWAEFKNIEKQGTSVAQMMTSSYKAAVRKNCHLIRTLGQVNLVTCTQKLAQQGYRENEGAVNPGNVIKILELVASHDGTIKRLDSGPKNAKYTSPEIQNEMILTCSFAEIIQEVNEAGVFSILVDESKGVSKMEKTSFVIRYFYDEEIQESFLEFKAAFQLDAEALTNSIPDIL